MPATTNIIVLAQLRQWTDADGVTHRHARRSVRRQAFDSHDGTSWSPAMSPGPRPWTDALLTRAPATLAECAAAAGARPGRLFRQSSQRAEHSFTVKWEELHIRADEAVASDWTYSDDAGKTWESPN